MPNASRTPVAVTGRVKLAALFAAYSASNNDGVSPMAVRLEYNRYLLPNDSRS